MTAIDILRAVLDFVIHIQFIIAASTIQSSSLILTISWCTVGTSPPGWSLSGWRVSPQFKKEFVFVKFACLALWAVAIVAVVSFSPASVAPSKTDWIF